MGFKWHGSLLLTPQHKVKSALRAFPPQREMLSTKWGHILMLQPLNLLLGSGVSKAVLTCTGTAFGHRNNLIPISQAALANAQENVFSRLSGCGGAWERY